MVEKTVADDSDLVPSDEQLRPCSHSAPRSANHDNVNGDAFGHDDAGRAGQKRERRKRRMFAVAAIGLSVVVVALLAGVTWLGLQSYHDRQDAQHRASALRAARAVAVNLTAINYKNAQQDVQRLLDSATGEFRKRFKTNVDIYLDAVQEEKVVVTSKVAAAGMQSLNRDTARVLLGINSRFRSAGLPKGQTRHYRMVVELEQQSNGQWLASRVVFIP